MPYVSNTSAGYRTTTVTYTSTHTITAMPVATQSRSDVATAEVGDVTNVLTLAGFAISLTGFAFTYYRGLPSGAEIEHWRKLVKKWKAWMHNLPPDMKQRIMQDNPTLMTQLETDLTRLDAQLESLEWNFASSGKKERYNWGSDLSRQYRHANQTMNNMQEVWKTSTERYRDPHPFQQALPIAYPTGVVPPPQSLSWKESTIKNYQRLRASIANRPSLSQMSARALPIIDSMWASAFP
ncbi:hypothetical protein K466DRAFT_603010 [Polyporus arcularius HHB13444]|uniref:Uncharacterized protein n=1 Tax=Polyporus arcularius HHB13444 TaxID=1314778 RepID=A0A5C3P189_9APHY|nr:hypothetical protein K466DRAFT_603010 [Polyporus arcularius HHB13444]